MKKLNVPEINRRTKKIEREAEREQPARNDKTYTLYCGGDFIKSLNSAMELVKKRQRKQLLKQNVMNETVLEKILTFVFGHKYYANIINTRGTDTIEMSSFIHRSLISALKHKKQIESTRMYIYVETVSFRSRKHYKQSPFVVDTEMDEPDFE